MLSDLVDRLASRSVGSNTSSGAIVSTVVVVVVGVVAVILRARGILTRFRSLRFCWRFMTLIVSWACFLSKYIWMSLVSMTILLRVGRDLMNSIDISLVSASN